MAEQKQDGQNLREIPMSFLTLVILTGLIGGIFWSGIAYLAYILNLTEIHPNVILDPWMIGAWKKGWLGTVLSILMIGVVSIGVSLIYYATLRRFPSIFVGMGYGIALFMLVFFVLNPIFPGIGPVKDLARNTIITSLCFYILYGIFIGYSISFEESEIKYKEKRESKAPN
ncbi:hypothetical protein BGM26_10165 [Bacillus sp. FJAT-29790]|uniref:YqhR family membrane protein n=1 Tax=Bacillus sp. FJAT-29790 TaxID=1895002 RepID=UPI001C2175DA|nr:YqhR family membrane protein [Bacillus sp. FJAT-29790]MBU8879347.1 hypothetical protein [Bacillus sp. FJAT-29790]